MVIGVLRCQYDERVQDVKHETIGIDLVWQSCLFCIFFDRTIISRQFCLLQTGRYR